LKGCKLIGHRLHLIGRGVLLCVEIVFSSLIVHYPFVVLVTNAR
jgi:hypothetical protein